MANYLDLANLETKALPPQQLDPVGSFAKGYAALPTVDRLYLDNALVQQKVVQEQAKRNALAQFGQSGNIKDILTIDPAMAESVGKVRDAEAKSTLDFLYLTGGAIAQDPSRYPEYHAQVVQKAGSAGDLIKGMIPPPDTSPDKLIQAWGSFKTAYERAHKIGPEVVPVLTAKGELTGIQVPKGTIQLKPEKTTVEEKAIQDIMDREGVAFGEAARMYAEQQAKAKGKYDKQMPGTLGALVAIHDRINPDVPLTEEGLLGLHAKFARETAKTKNPVEVAAGLLRGTEAYNSAMDPKIRTQMLNELTAQVSVLMGTYSGKSLGEKGGKPKTEWMQSLPPASAHPGRTVEDKSGQKYKSDGNEWIKQ